MKVHVKILTTPDIPVGTLFQRHSACRRSLLLMSDHAPARRRVSRISSSHIATSPVPTTLSSKQPPPLNGCASHPAGKPGAVVVKTASPWTFAHEQGHDLGLSHVNNNDRLMTGNGTFNITNPPPDLIASECATMQASPITGNL